MSPGRFYALVDCSFIESRLIPLMLLLVFLLVVDCTTRISVFHPVVSPPKNVPVHFLEERRDNLDAYVNLLFCSHAILHWYYDTAKHLRNLHQSKAVFIDELRHMQIIKLDVVAYLWNFANVKFTVLLVVVIRYLHPPLKL